MAQRKSKRATQRSSRAPAGRRQAAAQMVFGKKNYLMLVGSLALIVLGYAVMAFDNARGLTERGDHISLDSPLSLVVSPLILLAGYVGIAVAILWREKKSRDDTEKA
jgi:hypothetical protein